MVGSGWSQAARLAAPGSAPHGLVSDMVRLALHDRGFAYSHGLVVELRRIIPFGDPAVAG